MGKISGAQVRSFWFDPKNGNSQEIGVSSNAGQQTFIPPSSGYGQDWVLVVDDASKNYSLPDQKK
jgi:hypothetical protein